MITIKQTSWTTRFQITSLLVNSQGRLGLYGLLNLLQETAWMHAENLGFGLKEVENDGFFWVITRQNLQMNSWPQFGDGLEIKTWLRPPDGAFISREFSISNQQGEEIGTCTTTWLALDRKTKKILPAEDLRPWAEITSPKTTNLIAEKIPVTGDYKKLARFRVRNSDLDTNQHVNNTKYAQWILDSIPYELHKSLYLKAYSVNFLAETHLGDEVEIFNNLDTPDPQNSISGLTKYKGCRTSDEKVLFTAQLGWEKRL